MVAIKELNQYSDDKSKVNPMVSVIVPTYNRPDMLIETLKSILNQTYNNFEIIVVNDAGVEIGNIISDLNLRNNNITYIKHTTNKDRAAARNTGIKAARGKYIAYLDDDDIYYPGHLETLVKFLENSNYKVTYTDANRAWQEKQNGEYVVTKRDVPYSFDFDYDRILVGNFVPVLCFMHQKACLDEVGGFDEDLTTHEDWDLWIRMSRKYQFAHIEKITCEFRWREDGTTTTSARGADFIRTAIIIYEKYKEYAKDKPHVLAQQKDCFENWQNKIYKLASLHVEHALKLYLAGDDRYEKHIREFEYPCDEITLLNQHFRSLTQNKEFFTSFLGLLKNRLEDKVRIIEQQKKTKDLEEFAQKVRGTFVYTMYKRAKVFKSPVRSILKRVNFSRRMKELRKRFLSVIGAGS